MILINGYIGGFYGEFSSVGHSIASVDGEIKDDLLDLAGVSLDVPHRVIQRHE